MSNPTRLALTPDKQHLVFVLQGLPNAKRVEARLRGCPAFDESFDSVVAEPTEWTSDTVLVVEEVPATHASGCVVTLTGDAGDMTLDLSDDDSITRGIQRARELVFLRRRVYVEGQSASNADKLRRLNRIGAALADIHHLPDLLGLVLTEARKMVDADAGSVFIIEQGKGAKPPARKVLGRAVRKTQAVAVKGSDLTSKLFSLRFAAAQNDSVEIPFKEIVFPANLESIAGYTAITGQVIRIDDAYDLADDVAYKFNKAVVDEAFGYRTCSILSVPLKNMSNDVVGVLQLINRKRDPLGKLRGTDDDVADILPFSDEDVELATSLAAQAGVAIENARLMDAITHLFERFVIACIQAVEQRDPATAGHSGRVDRITMALAEAVNRQTDGPYKDEFFDDAESVELHYASLLHDFGKIGVREHVLTKAEKLFPAQIQAIDLRAEVIRAKLQLALIDDELTFEITRLDDHLAFIREHTKPVFMTDEKLATLKAIYEYTFPTGGEGMKLLTDEDYHSLQTRKGTLNPEERREIENHVSASWDFLKRIPWTADLARVPEIAGQHHEKMNAKGYPNGVPADETPLGSRLMAVADVFDSLTASDRPYKPAIPLERALEILDSMAKFGDLDPDVVELFNQEKIWERLRLKVVRMDDATDAQKAAR